jgi:release factor glutamine methyltransferase
MQEGFSRPHAQLSTAATVLAEAVTIRSAQGVDTAPLDAEVLLSHTLGLSRAGLYVRLSTPLTSSQREMFWSLIARRAQREPLAYLTGEREFWSLTFTVSPAVLIPRPETEIVVETALRLLAQSPAHQRHSEAHRPNILEIGTGSGCIAIALAKELPNAELWAVDISMAALTIAQGNAQRHKVSDHIHFQPGDLFSPITYANEQFDLIVSNPPYIAQPDLATLQPEVRDWEPRMALDGGHDGLDFYRRLVTESPSYLRPGGWLVVELDAGQVSDVLSLVHAQHTFGESYSVKDYADHERVVVAYKAGLRIS